MTVVHFQRKPHSGRCFSTENYFATLREEMAAADVQVEVAISRYVSQGVFKRLYNVVEAYLRQKDVNHITGDVHYLNLLFHKRRTILTVLDCGFLRHPSPLARAVLKMLWLTLPARKSAYITCISEATKADVIDHVRFDPKRILVIPVAIDHRQFPFTPRPFNTDRPTVLHIGTTPNKNLERVAQALAGLRCRLDVIGPLADAQRQALEANRIDFRNDAGLSNRQVVEKYQEADLLLFASTFEGFGMPILEAQLTGRPVVTSSVSAMPEVGRDSVCYVDPFDVESIRRGVVRVIDDESYRAELIEKGRENAARFSSKSVAETFLELYETIASGS
jgi:glycosyltransferase involved in cell wall biosynthesis